MQRDVQTIDIRLPDRLVLRVSPETPKETPVSKKGAPRRRTHEHNGRSAGTRKRSGTAPSGGAPRAEAEGQSRAGRRIRPRGSLIAAVDIGTTKVCCFIARISDDNPRVLGIGHQISRGVRSGTIVDLEAAGTSVVNAVHAAEQMAGETIQQVVDEPVRRLLRLTPCQGRNQRCRARDHRCRMQRVLEQRLSDARSRAIATSSIPIPVGFSIDDSRGIRDPRGMFGERLGVNMHIGDRQRRQRPQSRRRQSGVRISKLDALVVSPYAAGLACLVEDEIALGVTVIDMGGGTTTIGVFFDGNLIYADYVPVGGCHVTNDIARGLSTPVAHAERMKALFGSAISSSTDEREMIAVPQVGEEDEGHVNHVPKSLLVGIIAPRIEETFELVRNRLEASGFDKMAGRRVVLTGGACQLHGAREFAGADSRQAGSDWPATAGHGPG